MPPYSDIQKAATPYVTLAGNTKPFRKLRRGNLELMRSTSGTMLRATLVPPFIRIIVIPTVSVRFGEVRARTEGLVEEAER
jgi:hypothetical protein